MKTFEDRDGISQHDEFQAWRDANPDGMFLNFVTQLSTNLHGAQCGHLGSTDWMADSDGTNSLTRKRKVCADSEDKLFAWAKASRVSVEPCKHCMRDGFISSSPVGNRAGSEAPELQSHVNYWLVRGSPAENGAFEFIKRGERGPWRTKRPPRDWRAGDRLLFWASSPRRELIALGEFEGETGEVTSEGETLYNVHYLSDVAAHPLTLDELRNDHVLQGALFLKNGPAASVLRLTVAEGEHLHHVLTCRNPSMANVWPELSRADVGPLAIVPGALQTKLVQLLGTLIRRAAAHGPERWGGYRLWLGRTIECRLDRNSDDK